MPHLTFPIATDGLVVEALVGLDTTSSMSLAQSGRPIPLPIRVRGLIDTGTDASAVSLQVVQTLGLTPAQTTKTHTIVGQASVELYRVSLSISGMTGGQHQMLHEADLLVLALAGPLPGGIALLIGMDVLSQCLLIVDGPGRQFTLSF